MARRLTLHIGSHKTGTTTLQRFLRQNATTLKARGIAYAHGKKSSVSDCIGVVSRADFLPLGCRLRNPAEFRRILTETNCDNVVASSESFSYFFHAEPIAELAQLLRPQFDEIRILVYLRRQDRHALSHHQEAAKAHYLAAAKQIWGNELKPLPTPTSAQALYLDYNRRIGHWSDVFGDASVTARVFDPDRLKDNDLIADALSVLGIDGKGLDPIDNQNASLGAQQSWIGHLMNRAGVAQPVIASTLRAAGKGPRPLPSRAEAEAFYAPWRTGNAALNLRLGIGVEPDLFNEDFSDYPETASPAWDLSAAEAVLDVAMRQLAICGFGPDDLREATGALRESNPELALRFAKAALALKPNGPALRKLVDGLTADARPTGKKKNRLSEDDDAAPYP